MNTHSEINEKVVQANELITSVAKMDKIPLKFFELAVAQIDVENPPLDNTIYLSKSKMFSFFKVKDRDRSHRFNLALDRMCDQAYFRLRKKTDKGYKHIKITPIPYVEWNEYNDEVLIRFDQAIIPYLIGMDSHFTKYAIADLIELNSKYSLILYKWFVMNYNQYEYYMKSPTRKKQQLDQYKNPIIKLDELRRLTDTEKEYEQFSNFRRRVLEGPIKEISKFTPLNVSFELIKIGKKVTSIQFFITKKKIIADALYKEEQQDPEYLLDKEQREVKKQNDYLSAQKNPYTTHLLKYGLLSGLDIIDEKLMIDLSYSVYKEYDKLAELAGAEQVEVHISYLKDHMQAYSKQNILGYLLTSIKDYLKKEY